MDLSEKLKKARLSLGKSQRQMAETIGKSFPAWQQYEGGKSVPGGQVFEEFTKLGFNVSWFFNDDVPMMLKEENHTLPDVKRPTSSQPAGEFCRVAHMPSDNLGMAEGMTILGRIYGSGDQVFIRAINANLHAFNEALDNKAQAQQAVEKLNLMEKRMGKLENRLTKLEEENDELKKRHPAKNQHQATG